MHQVTLTASKKVQHQNCVIVQKISCSSSPVQFQNIVFFSSRFLCLFTFLLGMSIVLAVAEGEVFVNDAEIQKSALQVIINCVCAPDKRISSIGKFVAGMPRRRLPHQTKASESVLIRMWNVVQSNNGIKVYLLPNMYIFSFIFSLFSGQFGCLNQD